MKNVEEIFSNTDINNLTLDSRQVQAGDVFFAIQGHEVDGHNFIQQATDNGASYIVGEKSVEDINEPTRNRYIQVPDLKKQLSAIAHAFYQEPSKAMKMAAITGTNGKTSVGYILQSILAAADIPSGLIGTVGYLGPGESLGQGITTPDAITYIKLLHVMREQAARCVVSEVSSAALDQDRTAACQWDVAAFTNLSRDHVDYHSDMEAYFDAKCKLFDNLMEGDKPQRYAVINRDDSYGMPLLMQLQAAKLPEVTLLTYGIQDIADVFFEDIIEGTDGMKGRLRVPGAAINFQSPLFGQHNRYNILCAAGMAHALGLPTEAIAKGLSHCQQIPGRLQRIPNQKNILALVDYAHTPDAIKHACASVKPLISGRLISVFGCGGDRDAGKRPMMGQAVAKHSDVAIVTNDNPRTEDPARIAKQILEGMQQNDCDIIVELDRRGAIEQAVAMAQPGDCILVLGKGHEDYQETGKERRPFSDVDVLEAILC